MKPVTAPNTSSLLFSNQSQKKSDDSLSGNQVAVNDETETITKQTQYIMRLESAKTHAATVGSKVYVAPNRGADKS